MVQCTLFPGFLDLIVTFRVTLSVWAWLMSTMADFPSSEPSPRFRSSKPTRLGKKGDAAFDSRTLVERHFGNQALECARRTNLP